MSDLQHHPVTATLTAHDAERLRLGLIREAEAAHRAGSDTYPSRVRPWSRPTRVGVAAVAILVAAFITFDVGRTSRSADAMLTITSHGEWVDVAPNLSVDAFDADAAVDELRASGFNAERGRYLILADPDGGHSIRAPDTEGPALSSHAFFFQDGTEVLFHIEGPPGANVPVTTDGAMIDWVATADAFGLRDPADGRPGLELKRDAPVTIWILTAP